MDDLNFQIDGATPIPYSAAPTLAFDLSIRQAAPTGRTPDPVQSVLLRCQIRIEPAGRRYAGGEPGRLHDLFGEPARWGQTLRGMLWTHVTAVVAPFSQSTRLELAVPCTFDFNVAATKYFDALESGEVPLCFLFSGTVFYQSADGTLQVSQIPWEKEANFRLPVETWRRMMDLYYPNTAWLCLRKDVFDRLSDYKSSLKQPTWEYALEQLLLQARESVTP